MLKRMREKDGTEYSLAESVVQALLVAVLIASVVLAFVFLLAALIRRSWLFALLDLAAMLAFGISAGILYYINPPR